MIRILQRLLHRPALDLGSLGRAPRTPSRLRNERFVSYLAANNSKRINTDLQDALLASRRFARQILVFGAIAAMTWIAIESAQAIGVF